MTEVESQPVGPDERAGLLDVLAQHLAQRVVQHVGAGVIATNRRRDAATSMAAVTGVPGSQRAAA